MTLTKSGGGLGFSFLMCELDPPMRDFGTLIRIKKLFPGQPAQQSGRILEGDVLLAINGQSLKKLTYPVRPHLSNRATTNLPVWQICTCERQKFESCISFMRRLHLLKMCSLISKHMTHHGKPKSLTHWVLDSESYKICLIQLEFALKTPHGVAKHQCPLSSRNSC